MSDKSLVIVESPAKARTIEKYLGKDFKVIASYGHVRDLIPKEGAVDTEHDFAMNYAIIEKNKAHVDEIKKAVKKVKNLYLATDPDREGEAIAWHVYQLLQESKLLKSRSIHRAVFHQITKKAITEAIANPRHINMHLVNSQQTRRALDYLVGFNLSPLLWRKIRQGLSAGRVQSPALRLIVERELEIEKFKSQEYWTIVADCLAKKKSFLAKLTKFKGEKVEQFSWKNEKDAKKAENHLTKTAKGKLIVDKIEKKTRKRNPSAPFITSTLQQEAARKLGFSARRTMQTAQQLYEGIDTGDGSSGLITYMRTDSVTLAGEAIDEMRDYILKTFGKENLPEQVRVYKTKAKNAQEAHEAIRPISVLAEPSQIKNKLTKDQFRLYELIWKRTLASQMESATINTVSVDLLCGDNNIFRVNGSTIVHPGFISLYQTGKDDSKEEDEDKEKILPEFKEGEKVKVKKITGDQHFTEPPPRYSEASLIKTLEEYGIGRPSTYASIIHTLIQRAYTKLDQKRFHPTDVGRIVNHFLTQYFTQYVDYDFTAELEDHLDTISRGEADWLPLLKKFWKPFKKQVDHVAKTVTRADVTHEELKEKCPKCGKKLIIRLGKNGRFIGCSGFPDCKYTRPLENSDASEQLEEKLDRKCPECGSELVYRFGKYGKFIGCSNYPKCHHMESLKKAEDTGITCPKCGKGTLIKRRSRRGQFFYGCSKFPKCRYIVGHEPLKENAQNVAGLF